jgi:hypothetical protein
MPVQSWRRSRRAGGVDHQHIASDSAQAEVRHHQDQEPDRQKASGSLGVQVSAINYFHARRRPAIGRSLSVPQDMTPVVADHSQLHFFRIVPLAPGALKKATSISSSSSRQLRQAAPSARRLHSARRYSVQARREKGRAKPDRSWVSPTSAAPGAFAPEEVSQCGRYSSAGANHSPRKGIYATNARGSDDNAPHFTSRRRRDRVGWLRGQRWITVMVPIRPVRPRVVTSNVITPRPAANLGRLPLLVVLDLPVVARSHRADFHGPLTFKDRMALPPISVRSVSTTCTVTSCAYRSMHALDELQERGRA